MAIAVSKKNVGKNLYCDILKNTIKDAEKFIKGSEENKEDKPSKNTDK